jgi:hypothetical protein
MKKIRNAMATHFKTRFNIVPPFSDTESGNTTRVLRCHRPSPIANAIGHVNRWSEWSFTRDGRAGVIAPRDRVVSGSPSARRVSTRAAGAAGYSALVEYSGPVRVTGARRIVSA